MNVSVSVAHSPVVEKETGVCQQHPVNFAAYRKRVLCLPYRWVLISSRCCLGTTVAWARDELKYTKTQQRLIICFQDKKSLITNFLSILLY